MKRQWHPGAWIWIEVLRSPEGDPGGGGGDPKPEEAIKRAQAERDAAIAKVEKLATEVETLKKAQMTDEQRKEYDKLKADQAKAEEERKRREGEFDSWKAEITTSHTAALAAKDEETAKERKAREALENDIAAERIFSAFASASEYFGTEKSKTVLSPLTAFRSLREFCAYENVSGKKMIVVRKPDGSRILGDDGNPAPFAEAVGKLIAALPDKDQILRGSQKVGSGSPGGSPFEPGDVDLDHLTDEQLRADPSLRQRLHDRSAKAGGIVMGRGFAQKAPK